MEDEIYEAEIFQSSSDNVLNITLGATIAVSIIFLLLGASVGHVLTEPAPDSESIKEWWLTPLHDRHTMDLDRKAFVAQNRSALPVNGTLEVQTYTEHFISNACRTVASSCQRRSQNTCDYVNTSIL